MQATNRERLFRRAWKLDLAGEIKTYNDRLRIADERCNAAAYYAEKADWGRPDFGGRSAIDPAVLVAVDTSVDPQKYHDSNFSRYKSRELIRSLDEAIDSESRMAIRLYFIAERDTKEAGKKLAMGRAGDQAANLAVALHVKIATNLILPILRGLPSDHEFHDEWISSERLGLCLRDRRDRPRPTA